MIHASRSVKRAPQHKRTSRCHNGKGSRGHHQPTAKEIFEQAKEASDGSLSLFKHHVMH